MKKTSYLLTALILIFALAFSVSAIDKTAPVLNATSTDSSVTLSWNTVEGATGYRVYQLKDDATSAKLADVTETKYTVSDLTQNTKYTYSVKAFAKNEDGTKVWGKVSDQVTIATKKVSVSDFKLSKRTADSFTFTWTESKAAKGYRILLVNADGTTTTKLTINDSKTTTAIISGLTANNNYSFLIQPYVLNADGKKVYGEKSAVISKKTKLETPQKLTFKSAATDKISFSWSAVKGAESYQISVRRADKADYTVIGTITKTEATLTKLQAGTRYYIRVVALSKDNTSANSEILKAYSKPAAVKDLKTSSVETSSLSVQWSKGEEYTKYQVYISKSKTGNWILKKTTKNTSVSFTALDAATTYYIKVVPVIIYNGINEEGAATTISAKTKSITLSLKGSTTARKGEYVNLSSASSSIKSSEISWTTSNSNVVSVSGKKLFAAGKGTATVTAKYAVRRFQKPLQSRILLFPTNQPSMM